MNRSLNRGLKKQVHPALAAVLVIAVLIAVQWAWWKGLIYREPLAPPRAGSPAGPVMSNVITIAGDDQATVDTLTGDLDPGDADGPGHAARFDRPTGLAIDGRGNIYAADTGNHRVRMIAPDGQTTTLAGSAMGYADGPAAQAEFDAPCGVCVAPDGSVYVADTGNDSIRRIKDGQVTTVIGRATSAAGRAPRNLPSRPTSVAFLAAARQLLVSDASGHRIMRFTLDGNPAASQVIGGAATALACGAPGTGVAIPDAGTLVLGGKTLKNVRIEGASQSAFTLRHPVGLYPVGQDWLVTDAYHPALFRVHGGSATVLAGACTSAQPMRGFRDGDGSRAQFSILSGVVADGKGHVYVADTANNTIRRITMPSDGGETL